MVPERETHIAATHNEMAEPKCPKRQTFFQNAGMISFKIMRKNWDPEALNEGSCTDPEQKDENAHSRSSNTPRPRSGACGNLRRTLDRTVRPRVRRRFLGLSPHHSPGLRHWPTKNEFNCDERAQLEVTSHIPDDLRDLRYPQPKKFAPTPSTLLTSLKIREDAAQPHCEPSTATYLPGRVFLEEVVRMFPAQFQLRGLVRLLFIQSHCPKRSLFLGNLLVLVRSDVSRRTTGLELRCWCAPVSLAGLPGKKGCWCAPMSLAGLPGLSAPMSLAGLPGILRDPRGRPGPPGEAAAVQKPELAAQKIRNDAERPQRLTMTAEKQFNGSGTPLRFKMPDSFLSKVNSPAPPKIPGSIMPKIPLCGRIWRTSFRQCSSMTKTLPLSISQHRNPNQRNGTKIAQLRDRLHPTCSQVSPHLHG